MSKEQIKRTTFNLKIPEELFEGLNKCVSQHKKLGIKITKTHIIEKYLFHYLKDLGFLDKKYIKTAKEKYSH